MAEAVDKQSDVALRENKNTIQAKRILKECFWEYDFDVDDLLHLATSDHERDKRFLFEKILLNSTKLFVDLKIFEREQLKKLIESYKVPTFNHDYIARRKNMAEVYFLNKPITVNELRWVA
jgi:hypothetical protein